MPPDRTIVRSGTPSFENCQVLAIPRKIEPGTFSFSREAGKLGKKSGQGFYTWVDGKAHKSKVGAGDTAALAERMLKPLLEATQRLVREGVVADAGVIFGTAFAPYTGGPMNYLANR
jgi:hypothetical protein